VHLTPIFRKCHFIPLVCSKRLNWFVRERNRFWIIAQYALNVSVSLLKLYKFVLCAYTRIYTCLCVKKNFTFISISGVQWFRLDLRRIPIYTLRTAHDIIFNFLKDIRTFLSAYVVVMSNKFKQTWTILRIYCENFFFLPSRFIFILYTYNWWYCRKPIMYFERSLLKIIYITKL